MKEIPILYHNNALFKEVYASAIECGRVSALGIIGSKHSFLIKSLFNQHHTSLIWILNNKEEAAYFLNDLEALIGSPPLFFPASFRSPYNDEEIENANVLLRAKVLKKLIKK